MTPPTDIDFGVLAAAGVALMLLLVWAWALNSGHTYR